MAAIPNLTIRELGYLVALADHGHFGNAAEACCIGQPTLSTQLGKLEKKLGVALFERTNKSVQLTPAGQKVLVRARQIIADAEHIIDFGHELTDPLSGRLRLGIIPTLSVYMLTWLVPALAKAAPKLKLVPHEDLTNHLIAKLRNHELEAALLALPVHEHDFTSIPLFDEPFWAALPASNPLTKRSRLRSSDLSRERLLLLSEGHCLRDQAIDLCGRANSVAELDAVDFRATSLETIHQMVANGLGCTLMPEMAMTHHKGHEAAVAWKALGKNARRRIGLVYRSSYPLDDDMRSLAKIVVVHCPTGIKRLM